MGLTLIHGNSQPNTKPRVFVVAEPSVHMALTSDLELDVYPECFDYDSFVKASLSKSISTNNAIVIVSDSLSQRVAPLEAVIALVRSNVILIPWKSTESEIGALNVASSSPRPTANTLRRAIFQHAGMNDLPPRFDGDDYIEEPPDARVMNFAPQHEEIAPAKDQVDSITSDRSMSPLDWFTDPETQESEQIQPEISEPIEQTQQVFYDRAPEAVVQNSEPIEKEILAASVEFLPPIEQQRIEEEKRRAEQELIAEQAAAAARTASVQEDEPSFLPEFFAPKDLNSLREKSSFGSSEVTETPTVEEENKAQHSKANIDAFWHDQLGTTSETKPNIKEELETEKWISNAFSHESDSDSQTPAVSPTLAGSWSVPAPHELAKEQDSAQSDSLELEAYVSNSSDLDTYEVEDNSPATFVPDVAFTPSDSNGSQQMWTMFDTKMEPVSAQSGNSLSEFPDGTDHRKAINLFEPLVLCVYSPKGGVGKTSISVNLAARLAYTTRLQVCIVDLDIAFGNVGTRLGLYNPTVRELLNESHIDGESLARNLVYDRRSGLFALLAPLRPETGTNRRKFSPAAYKKILSLLKERFDVVILDCPVELRDPLVSGFALTEAGQVVMVVNNEQATLLDARRAVEAMCRPKDSQRLPGLGIDPHNVGMVVNQKVDNVGREVDDIKAILGGGDPNHPSRQIEILSVIADDRQLWVGNANMARTVATSGENDVDQLLDDIWGKILPDDAAAEFESQQFNAASSNPLDEILSRGDQNAPKKKRKLNLFGKKSD